VLDEEAIVVECKLLKLFCGRI